MSVVVTNLTKIFNEQRAVNNLSFEAHPGEILGFLGPNGAGKTTTMKMICCYYAQNEGHISVEGIDTLTDPMTVRRNIGYLPEQNPLYKDMYVKEFLSFVASVHKLPNANQRISEVIDMTGLGKEQHKIIGTLSKGYRQRVGLAQAIIHNPKVLILDEPTSGLDMNQILEIRNLIRELGKEKTVIFSSHIMQEIEALCHRVVIINNGEKVADDPLASLQTKLAGNVITHVVFQSNNADYKAWLGALPGVSDVAQHEDTWTVISSAQHDIRPLIFREAYQRNAMILELYNEKANVEDVFRKLTKLNGYV